jgi:hypothetical protein
MKDQGPRFQWKTSNGYLVPYMINILVWKIPRTLVQEASKPYHLRDKCTLVFSIFIL